MAEIIGLNKYTFNEDIEKLVPPTVVKKLHEVNPTLFASLDNLVSESSDIMINLVKDVLKYELKISNKKLKKMPGEKYSHEFLKAFDSCEPIRKKAEVLLGNLSMKGMAKTFGSQTTAALEAQSILGGMKYAASGNGLDTGTGLSDGSLGDVLSNSISGGFSGESLAAGEGLNEGLGGSLSSLGLGNEDLSQKGLSAEGLGGVAFSGNKSNGSIVSYKSSLSTYLSGSIKGVYSAMGTQAANTIKSAVTYLVGQSGYNAAITALSVLAANTVGSSVDSLLSITASEEAKMMLQSFTMSDYIDICALLILCFLKGLFLKKTQIYIYVMKKQIYSYFTDPIKLRNIFTPNGMLACLSHFLSPEICQGIASLITAMNSDGMIADMMNKMCNFVGNSFFEMVAKYNYICLSIWTSEVYREILNFDPKTPEKSINLNKLRIKIDEFNREVESWSTFISTHNLNKLKDLCKICDPLKLKNSLA